MTYRLVVTLPDIEENIPQGIATEAEWFNATACDMLFELFGHLPDAAYRVFFRAFPESREIIFRSDRESFLVALQERVTACAGELRASDIHL